MWRWLWLCELASPWLVLMMPLTFSELRFHRRSLMPEPGIFNMAPIVLIEHYLVGRISEFLFSSPTSHLIKKTSSSHVHLEEPKAL